MEAEVVAEWMICNEIVANADWLVVADGDGAVGRALPLMVLVDTV